MTQYGKHKSHELQDIYKGYQGKEPKNAQYIFVGLDPNVAEDIEKSTIFEDYKEYLRDGVNYWKKNELHHPFLKNNYDGDGKKYHQNFAKLRLTSDFADKVSFVELLDFLTVGKTNYKEFKKFLNKDYLTKLDKDLSENGHKNIYIARGAYQKLYKIGKQFCCFDWLPKPEDKRTFNQIRKYVCGNITLYEISHFSDCISKAHLAEIRGTME